MRKSWAAVTVGVLIIAVLAVGWGIFKYINEGGKAEGYVVYARFHSALGLTPKSRVLSAGIRIGQIEDKKLDQETGKAKVSIRIDKDIKLFEDAIVWKKSASLLGEYYLDVDPGKPPKRQLVEGDEIMIVREEIGTGEILNEIGTTLPILKEILRDVHELTSGEVKSIATNVNKMIEVNSVTLERLLNRVDNIAASIESITRAESEDIKVSIKNIREITEGIKGLVGTSEGQVNATGQEVRNSLQKMQRSVDALDRTLQNLEKATGKIANGQGTVGKLINDPAIADNVEQITEDAGSFIRGVTRLQTIVGLRSEYYYLANQFKSYFQVYLAPRPDKFYLIEIVDDPRGFRTSKQRIIESSRDGIYSENIVETSERLRISFMFGKRIGFVTGRFGIKESTGGFGLDVHLLDERLTLSADIYDSHSNQYPRLTGRAFLSIYKRNIFLVGGVDDVFNYTKNRGGSGGFFDWFFGAQLVFNDEDLKSLLLFGGSSAASAGSK